MQRCGASLSSVALRDRLRPAENWYDENSFGLFYPWDAMYMSRERWGAEAAKMGFRHICVSDIRVKVCLLWDRGVSVKKRGKIGGVTNVSWPFPATQEQALGTPHHIWGSLLPGDPFMKRICALLPSVAQELWELKLVDGAALRGRGMGNRLWKRKTNIIY